MKGLSKRIDRLDGGNARHPFIVISVPEGWDSERSKAAGEKLARAAGYRGEFSIFPFDHRGDTEPVFIGNGFNVLISTLDEAADEGKQRRVQRQNQRAELGIRRGV